MNFNKITTRLLLIFLLISPLSLASLAGFYLYTFKQTLVNSQLRNLSSLADKKHDEIDEYINMHLSIIQILASSKATIEASQKLAGLFASEGNDSQKYLQAEQPYREYFKSLLDKIDFYDLLISDTKGNIIFSVRHEDDFGRNLNTGPYHHNSLTRGHYYAIEFQASQIAVVPSYAPSNDQPAIFLITPIIKGGKVLGTLTLQLDFAKFGTVTNDTTGLGKTGETVLAIPTENGFLHAGARKKMGSTTSKYHAKVISKQETSAPFNYEMLKHERDKPVFAAIRGNHGKGIWIDYTGTEIIGAWRYLPALEWGMVVKIDTEEALASYYQLRNLSLVALTLFLVISIIVAFLYGRKLVAPVHSMISLTNNISAGNLEQRVEKDGWYELNQLANSFNKMTDNLSISQHQLQQKVDELTQNTNRLDTAQHMAKLGDFSFDKLNKKFFWSDTQFEVLGYEPGSFTPTEAHFLAPIHPDDADDIAGKVKSALLCTYPIGPDKQSILPVLEYRILHPDGSLHWLRLDGVADLDEHGKAIRVWGTTQDFTERKHTEQLMQLAKEEAECANAAKTEFLSHMSHELRTPLNAIIGFGQLLQLDMEHPLASNQVQDVGEILSAGDHLLSLVTDILDLSLIEGNRLEFNFETIETLPIIKSCIKQIQAMADAHKINVSLDPCESSMVKADETRFKQVLFNLLTNAIKYNREGGSVRINHSVHEESIRISVHDSGAGISDEELPRLFRPFERLETAYEGIDGSGIGLALAKKLVEGMHGEIGVDSVVGKGSTFWFELPITS